MAWGDESSDAELITAARGGSSAAFGALYERHAAAARTVARQYTRSSADAEDVVSDAFARVYSIVRDGGGPDVAFRAYLFTVVRRLAHSRVEAVRRVQPTDDMTTFESAFGPVSGVDDPALAGFERGVVAKAYGSLPERWQAVLWYTEIERLPPAQVAPLLGLTANGVAALAYRAREGLREAYLQQHLVSAPTETCRTVNGKLGSYVRGGLARRETAQVRDHLETCETCRGLVLELGDVNHGLRGIIAPLVLGVAGLGALAAPLPVGLLAAVGAGAAGSGAAGAGAASGAAAGGATSLASAGAAGTSGAAGSLATGGATAVAGAGSSAAGGVAGGAAGAHALAGGAVAGSTAAGSTVAGSTVAGSTVAGTSLAGTSLAGATGAVAAGTAGAVTAGAGAAGVAGVSTAATAGALAGTSALGGTGAAATAATGAVAAGATAGGATAAGATALVGAGAASGAAIGGIGGMIAAIPGGVAGAVTAGVVGVSLAVGGALVEPSADTRPPATSSPVAPGGVLPGPFGDGNGLAPFGGAAPGGGTDPVLDLPALALPAEPSSPTPSAGQGPTAGPPAGGSGAQGPAVGPATDPPSGDGDTTVDPAPTTPLSPALLQVGGSAGTVELVAGQQTTVTITLVNAGETGATDLRAALLLPAGVALAGSAGAGPDRWQPCADDATAFCLPALAGEASSVLAAVLQVAPDAPPDASTNVTLRLSAADGGTFPSLSVPATVRPTPADLLLGDLGSVTLAEGVPQDVFIPVGNAGGTPARDVLATVSLPAGVSWVGTSAGPWGCTPEGTGASCRLDELPAGSPGSPTVRALALTVVADAGAAGVPGLVIGVTVTDAAGASRTGGLPVSVTPAAVVEPPVAPPVIPPVIPPVVPPVVPPVDVPVEPPVDLPVDPPADPPAGEAAGNQEPPAAPPAAPPAEPPGEPGSEPGDAAPAGG